MRRVFLSLLFVNIALFAWGAWFVHYHESVVSKEGVVEAGTVDDSAASGVDVPRLELLNERQQKTQVVESVRITSFVMENGGVGSVVVDDTRSISRTLCTLVGSFTSLSKAQVFVQKLSGLGAQSRVKNLLVSTTVGYWLHLSPLSSRKEVLRRLSELQRQGVDSYIIPDGELENGISLGMFSNRERAQVLQSSIEKLGYSPQIIEVPREKREVWVFLDQGEAVKIPANRWSALLSGKELLQKQQNLCSDVASS